MDARAGLSTFTQAGMDAGAKAQLFPARRAGENEKHNRRASSRTKPPGWRRRRSRTESEGLKRDTAPRGVVLPLADLLPPNRHQVVRLQMDIIIRNALKPLGERAEHDDRVLAVGSTQLDVCRELHGG